MMVMMPAASASIISIIGGPLLHVAGLTSEIYVFLSSGPLIAGLERSFGRNLCFIKHENLSVSEEKPPEHAVVQAVYAGA